MPQGEGSPDDWPGVVSRGIQASGRPLASDCLRRGHETSQGGKSCLSLLLRRKWVACEGVGRGGAIPASGSAVLLWPNTSLYPWEEGGRLSLELPSFLSPEDLFWRESSQQCLGQVRMTWVGAS